jgi:hypothetical protein
MSCAASPEQCRSNALIWLSWLVPEAIKYTSNYRIHFCQPKRVARPVISVLNASGYFTETSLIFLAIPISSPVVVCTTRLFFWILARKVYSAIGQEINFDSAWFSDYIYITFDLIDKVYPHATISIHICKWTIRYRWCYRWPWHGLIFND